MSNSIHPSFDLHTLRAWLVLLAVFEANALSWAKMHGGAKGLSDYLWVLRHGNEDFEETQMVW